MMPAPILMGASSDEKGADGTVTIRAPGNWVA